VRDSIETTGLDLRPPSLLDSELMNSQMWLGGVLVALAAHVLLPVAAIISLGLLAESGLGDSEPEGYIEEHVVEARFVRRGKKLDPNKLPNRRVPRLSTAPDKSTVVSKNMNPEPPDKKDEQEPEDPVDDLVTRLGDRAKAFAEIAEERELEGDPEGVDFGTETEAKAGDIYRGKLKDFFQRGWTIPTTLGDTSKLKVTAEVEITRDLKVGASSILKRSGVPLFDQSVEDRFQQLRTLGTTLPEPPPEVAEQFLGKKININFTGKRP